MRYLRIFLLNAQYVFSHPSKSFVWLLIAMVVPLINLSFWLGALSAGKVVGVTLPFIVSYYLLLTVATSFIESHVERDIAYEDIQFGQLSAYLLKPFSYFWTNFYEDLPYRILLLTYGTMVLGILFLFFGKFLNFTSNPALLLGATVITMLAYFLSFISKTNLGMIAFWTTDIGGFLGLYSMVNLTFGGNIMPISLFPDWLARFTYLLPFPYMIYFPVIAFQGRLAVQEIYMVIFTQVLWIAILTVVYKLLWSRGIRKFSAVGQ